MRALVTMTLIAWIAGCAAPVDTANRRGTKAEAQAMVGRAIALFDRLGPGPAFKRMNDPKGSFHDRDLYVFVVGPDKQVVVQGADPRRIGLNITKIKDSRGALYGIAMLKAATPTGAWVDYWRRDPLTGKDLPKHSWVRLHRGYVFGVGVYK